MKYTICATALAAAFTLIPLNMQKWTEHECDGYRLITQKGGATLGYSPGSGIKIIYKDGYAFKDLNRNGKLEIYEDWRQPVEKRVDDLVSKLSIEEIAGLMLYSNHEAVPATSYDISDYNGKSYAESGAHPWDLSDNQKRFLKEDCLRHVLVTIIESPEVAARWNNKLQAYVEGLGHGIPANNSSDPRHSARSDAEFNAGGGGKISMWPGPLGLAAPFSSGYCYGSTLVSLSRHAGGRSEADRRFGSCLLRRLSDFTGRCGNQQWLGLPECKHDGKTLAGRRSLRSRA